MRASRNSCRQDRVLGTFVPVRRDQHNYLEILRFHPIRDLARSLKGGQVSGAASSCRDATTVAQNMSRTGAIMTGRHRFLDAA
jgi:hypothetical protein